MYIKDTGMCQMHWIDTLQDLEQMCHTLEAIAQSAIELPVPIAIDTEFVRENSYYPLIEVLQIHCETYVWLIDAAYFKYMQQKKRVWNPDHFHEGFKQVLVLLKDARFLKILHAAYGDQECILTNFNILMKPVFDTALAASLLGYGDTVGLSRLSQQILGISMNKNHTRADWSVRPLPEVLMDYASNDVLLLLPLYQHLKDKLDAMGRTEWCYQKLKTYEQTELYEYSPEKVAKKLLSKQSDYAADYYLLENLLKWREEKAQKTNIPRKWFLSDQVLIDITLLKPQNLKDLKLVRGLSKSILQQYASLILNYIQVAQNKIFPQKNITKDTHNEVGLVYDLSSENLLALRLLECFIHKIAVDHKISVKHLLNQHQMSLLLSSKPENVEELKKYDFFLNKISDEIVEKIFLFLKGNLGLVLTNYQLSEYVIK